MQGGSLLDSTGSPAGTVGLPTREPGGSAALWYRVVPASAWGADVKVHAGARGGHTDPPSVGGVSRSVSDEDVGSEKGWGPPVDGSLPGDLT